MSIPSRVAALLMIGVVGPLSCAAQAETPPNATHTPPDFLQRAQVAVAAGQPDRAVGLIAPRIRRLHRPADLHLAHATLCEAHLHQRNATMAGEMCVLAAAGEFSTGVDLDNLAAYRHLVGDADAGRRSSLHAAGADPSPQHERAEVTTKVAVFER